MAKKSKQAKKQVEEDELEDEFDDEEEYEEYDEEEDDDDDELPAVAEDAADDPYWWTPHLVLGLLLLTGLLGFFGLFNGLLPSASHDDGHSDTKPTATTVATAAPKPAAKKPVLAKPQQKAPAAPVYGAKHLLVAYKGSQRAAPTIKRTKEEAKKRAEEAAKKAAEAKKAKPDLKDISTAFSKLAAEYSDGPSAKRGGDLGRFRKGSMVPPFQAAVEKLKVGGVSGVVETGFGFHVILRTQ